jgi:spore germination protein KA
MGAEARVLKYLRAKFEAMKAIKQTENGGGPQKYTKVFSSLAENASYMAAEFDGCADFVHREVTVCGEKAEFFMMDNLCDKLAFTEGVLKPVLEARAPLGTDSIEEKYIFLRDKVLSYIDQREVFDLEECSWLIMTGFACLMTEGMDRAIVFGLQSYKSRSITEPTGETVMRGSREGFVEQSRINVSMLRRRIKNTNFKVETFMLGTNSHTEVCLAYMKNIASVTVLDSVRTRLRSIDIDSVMASGYIQAYFEDSPSSIFPTVGVTERPDTVCGKLMEGRVALIVDGTPAVLLMPYLFNENFQNMDDYSVSHYYATFTRILKGISFVISVLLPGLYVAIGTFHQSLMPSQLLYTLSQAEEGTPFPIFVEALMMQIIYEILREAGLRAPKQIGSSLNIVGAFLIGQAAVTAGIIGAPMVIIVALTATTSLVAPTLYEPGVIMRFAFIFAAGFSGMYGLTLAAAFFVILAVSLSIYGVPYTSPIFPFSLQAQRDVIIRAPWSVLTRNRSKVQDMPGSGASGITG